MGLKENLDKAQEAIKHVRSTVQRGACNKVSARLAAAGGIDAVIARDRLEEEEELKMAKAEPAIPPAGASLVEKKAFFEGKQQAAVAEKGALLPRVGPYRQPRQEPELDQARGVAWDAAGGKQAVVVAPLLVASADVELAKRGLRQANIAFLQGLRAKYLALGASRLVDIMAISDVVKAHGVGNCGEQSIVAYRWLYDEKVKPIDLMGFSDIIGLGYDHMWVIIGRNKDSKVGDLRSWGDEAVWCDPWQGDAGLFYSIDDFIRGAVRNLDARYKLNSVELVEAGKPLSLRRDE